MSRRWSCLLELWVITLAFRGCEALDLRVPSDRYLIYEEPFQVTWTYASNDPKVFRLEARDSTTGFQCRFNASSALAIDVSQTPVSILPPPSREPLACFLRAITTDGGVLSSSPAFLVIAKDHGPPFTLWPTPMPTMSTTPPNNNGNAPGSSKGHIPIGAIAGGIAGALVIVSAIFGLLYFRRRHRSTRRCSDRFSLLSFKTRTRKPTFSEKQEWLAQIHGAMAEAEKQSGMIRKHRERQSGGVSGSETCSGTGGHDTWRRRGDSIGTCTLHHEASDTDDNLSLASARHTSLSAAATGNADALAMNGGAHWQRSSLDHLEGSSMVRLASHAQVNGDRFSGERRQAELLKELRSALDAA
ncbi:hypothetical protein Hypma_013662 [Hypsizygus marmoreus]|uniref:Uncharacterized protein n=1 Tax=Hypsizygus marmoreus TaxID=39966 RepID=A0A369JII1_HYPMA|nr:hypothetical protein Hypma_013662 [Hypsizygus marmoreus]